MRGGVSGIYTLVHSCVADSIFSRNAEVDLTCPIEKGLYTVTHTVELPKEIPPGE